MKKCFSITGLWKIIFDKFGMNKSFKEYILKSLSTCTIETFLHAHEKKLKK